MSVIARTVKLNICTACGEPWRSQTEFCGPFCTSREAVEVEFVTASQLEGAVAALSDAVEAWEVEFGANEPPPWVEFARDVLANLGGQ